MLLEFIQILIYSSTTTTFGLSFIDKTDDSNTGNER